ncbi:hypothetical protein GXM_02986 [Nostoc sphaeroides CCNUC1]|uniref:Uncharacterized protein n=1 Tax=Nostoc sphaeroides CCNUC1 TaxID=2653204 RepID=A0A5P8W0E9_9NOSO|nr:hypothetical protein GXM_02986 [Nostoc sphaeroides CCNUC1]
MAKSFRCDRSGILPIGSARAEFTPVDKKEPTPLVEAGSRPSKVFFS